MIDGLLLAANLHCLPAVLAVSVRTHLRACWMVEGTISRAGSVQTALHRASWLAVCLQNVCVCSCWLGAGVAGDKAVETEVLPTAVCLLTILHTGAATTG